MPARAPQAPRASRPAPMGRRALLLLLGLSFAGLACACLAVLSGVSRGRTPPFLRPDFAPPAPRKLSPPTSTTTLSLAGSGTNLPLTRRLASAFCAQHSGVRVQVHQSIGSFGGVLALQDGVIDLALVSRSIQGQSRGLTVLPYARVAVVIATNPRVPDRSVDRHVLLAMYAGQRTRWRDGSRVVVIQRERGDSANRAVARRLSSFARLHARAAAQRRWRVVYRDDAMREALLATPGAVGLFDLGAIVTQHLPLRILAFEGILPSARAPLPAGYPFYKELSFVSRGAPTGLAADFVRFSRSPSGASIARGLGYQPVTSAPHQPAPPADPGEPR